MGFFGDLFGFGTEPKQKRVRRITEISDFDEDKIYPFLVSKNTKKYDLHQEYYIPYHTREGISSDLIIIYVAIVLEGNEDDERGDANMYQLKTANNYNEESFENLREKATLNLDNSPEPLEIGDFLEDNSTLKILTCSPGPLSSEKILSKKHMLEAHKMLGADELMVSIPRKGLIFICSKNINEADHNAFLNWHASMVLTEIKDLEFLCEDVFVVINGEVDGALLLSELSEQLNG